MWSFIIQSMWNIYRIVKHCFNPILQGGVAASNLLQQLLHLLPVLLLAVVDDVVPPPTLSNEPSQP